MNIQIVSNAINQAGGTNYTNEFVMLLPMMLDAENRELFMHVLNISYLLTIENVLKEKCGVRITLHFPTTSNSGIAIKYKTDMIYIPLGYYSLKGLISILNSYVYEYDVRFTVLNSGRIGVTYSIEREYWHSDTNIVTTNSAPLQIYQTFSQNTNEGTEFEMELTESLQYMLGLRKIVVHSSVERLKNHTTYFNETRHLVSAEEFNVLKYYDLMNVANELGDNNFACTFMGAELPDISDGVDKMFIYCEQLEMSIVGDTYAPLLAIVPLKEKDRGNGSLCVYTPPDTRQQFIKSRINELKIGLYDTTHTLIPFSSGTVNIECVVE
ncbi:Hypothetical predicted protein [Paramuricea clavata]|uniref:Uncharacterized protein n=1 Tax=Paramuricea clavata TaxID=317549 RepID=A0A6S7GUQ7_PARCT|nr:Hypothetical predicted protein [Paramuricea clavata]